MVLMDFNECCVTGGEDSDAGADTPAAGRAFWATGVVSAPRESSEKSLSGLLTERARDAKRRDRRAEGRAILECARRECATGRIRSVLDSIKVTGGEGGEAATKKVVGMALISTKWEKNWEQHWVDIR
ncbi:hypothetical protein B0H14DRAFT_2610080 [Mycena olivaceomarginata]|nr:hypothetical protein B0H14DRAFT_2610080 [Mycena olivaceomarginata]